MSSLLPVCERGSSKLEASRAKNQRVVEISDASFENAIAVQGWSKFHKSMAWQNAEPMAHFKEKRSFSFYSNIEKAFDFIALKTETLKLS